MPHDKVEVFFFAFIASHEISKLWANVQPAKIVT